MTVDLHLDTLWKMTKYGFFQIWSGERYSDVNLAVIHKGGLQSAVFALYLPHHLECDAERLLDEQIEFFNRQIWGEFRGYLALENGGLLISTKDRKCKIEKLEKFAKAGIKYLTLTHNYDNELGCSATDVKQDGMTEFGTKVVNRCEELGILVDVSHAADNTAYDAFIVRKKETPIIASHSGCRALLDHPRNAPDWLIKSIARSGGLVGVPFVKKFVGTRQGIVEHIDHIVQMVGIKHVAIGSDFDGAVIVDGVEMKNWNFFYEGLMRKGYSAADMGAISGGNFERLVVEKTSKCIK